MKLKSTTYYWLAVIFGGIGMGAACRREHHSQYYRDYRARNETPANVMWYTVYDAKTGDLLASGTSELCARRLGYKSANSFASACSHSRSGKHPAHKYIFEKEYIRRDEVDSLPPIRRKRKKACPCANADKPKG